MARTLAMGPSCRAGFSVRAVLSLVSTILLSPSSSLADDSGTQWPPSSLENYGLVLSLLAGLATRAYLRLPRHGGSVPTLTPHQLAFLSRGKRGLMQTVVAQLVKKGVLCVNTEKRALDVVERNVSDLSAVEEEILQQVRLGTTIDLLHRHMKYRTDDHLLPSFQAIKDALVNLELVIDRHLDWLKTRCTAALLLSFLGFFALSILISVLEKFAPLDWHVAIINQRLSTFFWRSHDLSHDVLSPHCGFGPPDGMGRAGAEGLCDAAGPGRF
ncbi:MAG: TIGR04222 domain-containing membrane protein [Cyanobacteriota bacterium]|nr:TIGR04222 domain-containing membrane protein [Cyanobacteriota bacterium]